MEREVNKVKVTAGSRSLLVIEEMGEWVANDERTDAAEHLYDDQVRGDGAFVERSTPAQYGVDDGHVGTLRPHLATLSYLPHVHQSQQ